MAISFRIFQPCDRLVRVVWFIAIAIAAFSLYNYPRSWWQELICATSLLWGPLCLMSVFVEFWRLMKRGFSFLGMTLLILNVMCAFKVASIVWPYVYSPAKSYSSLSYSVPTRIMFIDSAERSEDVASRLSTLIETEAPDVLIVARYTDAARIERSGGRYAHVLTSSLPSQRTVEIFSKAPIASPARTEYGFGALPAVLGTFETTDGARFQLGAMDLVLSSSQDSFNRSRLTSRRLASALKYSAEPRIVVGAFRASVTSQLVDMYIDQLKLRSIFFNSGLGRVGQSLVDSLYLSRNLNAFTARKIEVQSQREVRFHDHESAALIFTVRVPRTGSPSLGGGG